MGETEQGMDGFFGGIEETAKAFYDNCSDISYIYKGMSNVEGVFLWRMIEVIRPATIFESGIGRGRSMEMLLRAQSHYGVGRYVAVDIVPERVEWAKERGVEAYCSTASDAFAKHIGGEERVVCCVDGPKGGESLRELMSLMDKNNGCLSMFTHDCVPRRKTYRTIKKFVSGATCDMIVPPQKAIDAISFVNGSYIKSILSARQDVKIEEHLKRLTSVVFLFWGDQ